MKAFRAVLVLLVAAAPALAWGKRGHEMVNRLAIRCLPAELKPIYQKHEKDIVARAMEADEAKRKTGCEDVYHFIDLDAFGDPKNYPRSLDEGVRKHGFDAFLRAGLLPWRIKEVHGQLVDAWKAKDVAKIVELSAWLGHYAGDAHVPLHATQNYDGQLTKQDGVHARWESDMLDSFDLEKAVAPLLGQAALVEDPFEATFAVSLDSLSHVAAVLKADEEATAKEPLLKPGPDGKLPKKRGEAYYKELHEKTHVLAEQRLAKSATWAASLWYSAWVKAGKPAIE
jgi:hypothetical protein